MSLGWNGASNSTWSCTRLYRLLADEIGIEPSASIRQPHQDILSGHGGRAGGRASTRTAG